MIINILPIQHLLQQIFNLVFEILQDWVILMGVHQVLEFREDAYVFSWVEFTFFLGFEKLEFEEETEEVVIAIDRVDVDVQKGFNGFKTFGEFAHGAVMNGVTSIYILLGKDLS